MSWLDFHIRLWISMMLCTVCATQDQSPVAYVQVPSSDLASQSFTGTGAKSYKTLTVHNNILYIGGRGILYRQSADNITRREMEPVTWDVQPSAQGVCQKLPQGNSETCENFIRVVQPYNRTHILLCGSMALSPKNVFLNNQDGSVVEAKDIKTSLCSDEPADVASLLLVKESPWYTSIVSTSRTLTPIRTLLVKSLSSSTILRTSYGSGKMVENNPKFIHSFPYNEVISGRTMDKLYFVFGEATKSNGDGYRSRIAQVCANDRGNVYSSGKWTTFLKADLPCQTEETTPFKFDIVTHSTVSDDGILYGSFAPSSTLVSISAVCAYRVSDIQRTFRSQNYREASTTGNGPTIRADEIPQNPSPGECSYPGMGGVANATTGDFDSKLVSFILTHPLVDTPINPTVGQGGPLFTLDNEYITKIATQKVRAVDEKYYDVIFVGTKSGKLFKYLPMLKNGNVEIVELAEYTSIGGEVTGMVLSTTHNNLYVQTAAQVKQVSTGNCEIYTKSCQFCDHCRMCVLSRDPMCAWDSHVQRCADIRYSLHNSSVLFQSVESVSVSRCGEVEIKEFEKPVPHTGVDVVIGTTVSNPLIDVIWYNHVVEPAEELKGDTGKYHITAEKKLEISDFRAADVGRYVANYSVGATLVAVEAFTFKDHPVVPVSPTPPSTTESTTPNTKDSSFMNYTVTAPPLVETTIASGFTAGTTATIVILTILFFVCFLAIFFCFIWKRDCRICHSTIKSHKYKPETPPATRHDDDVTDGVRYTNSNNSNVISVTSIDDVTQEENVHLISEEKMPSHLSPPQDYNVPLRKKVAKVLPYEQESAPLATSSIEFIDDVSTPASEEDHQRKLPQRTKSIPSQNIRVKIDNDRVIKCNSIHRHKGRGTWLLEIDLPDDCRFDEDIAESIKVGSDDFEKTTDAFSTEEHAGEADTKTGASSCHDLEASGDNPASSNMDLPAVDTDSDSTLKAANSTIKQFDSQPSSNASTPRQYDTTKPFLASSYNSRFIEPSVANSGDGRSLQNSPWKINETDKSPTSTGSSSSNSSDKFHTAPPSPVGGNAG